MINEAPDPVMQRLARLPAADSDTARSDRVRARCHAALRRRSINASRPQSLAGRAIELALVAGFCLVYFSVVIREAWQLME